MPFAPPNPQRPPPEKHPVEMPVPPPNVEERHLHAGVVVAVLLAAILFGLWFAVGLSFFRWLGFNAP